MHIAVLDDNVADRNQMDRLLTRASDANRGTDVEVYYIDVFGSLEALIPNTAMYDAIFIDVIDSDVQGHEIARHIYEQGVSAKIILCIGKLDYRNLINAVDEKKYLYLNKPVRKDELKDILDICEYARTLKEPKIELRTKEETLYVKYEEFVSARFQETGKTTVKLKDGREITVWKDITSFKGDMSPYKFILNNGSNVLFSTYHIKEVKLFKTVLDDGTEIRLSPGLAGKLKAYLNKV